MYEFSPSRPKWEQISETITTRIAAGELRPDDKLSEVEMAAEFGVDRKTVRKAIASLRDARRVVTRKGMGSFVTHPEACDQAEGDE
ncbi:GntR family transcriptional regulator [Kitasatospora sp. NPDC001095]